MSLVFLAIAALIGFVCYKESGKFEQQHGRAPWSLNPIVWGIIGFLIGLFGALLLFIALKTTKTQPQYPGLAPVPQQWAGDPRYAQQPPPAVSQPQWAPPAQWGPPPSPNGS
jgi:hypothetical protein